MQEVSAHAHSQIPITAPPYFIVSLIHRAHNAVPKFIGASPAQACSLINAGELPAFESATRLLKCRTRQCSYGTARPDASFTNIDIFFPALRLLKDMLSAHIH